MKRLCLFLSLWAALLCTDERELFLSTPEQIASLTADPALLIGGVISPLSGMPVLRVTDLVARGAQEIVLSRTYLSPYMPIEFTRTKEHQGEYEKKALAEHLTKQYKGWQTFPHLRLDYYSRSRQLYVAEPSGVTLCFQLADGGASLLTEPYALSNISGDTPGGQYDIRNTRIAYLEGGKEIIVYAPQGTARHYRFDKVLGDRTLYLLDKEILPSGKRLTYHYEKKKGFRIDSQDPHEKHTYASLTVQGSPSDGAVRFLSSTGLTTDYRYSRQEIEWKIKEKKKTQQKKMSSPPLLSSAGTETITYCNHCLLASYMGKEVQFGIYNDGYGQPRHYRTKTLSLPVGQDGAFVPAFTFDYTPPVAGRSEGFTHVTSADGTSIRYHFSKELLLTAIEFFDSKKKLQREKRYTWNEQQWLESLEEYDGTHALLYRKSYSYDRFGNPIVERFTGNLTGHAEGETVITRRRFTQDGSHLLLLEEEENGKVTCYSYLPGTHLVTSKIIKDRERTIQSCTLVYDECHNLIESQTDDGIAKRKTRYIVRNSQPCLHQSEWIIDSYEQDGVEKILEKRRLLYDKAGCVVQEEVYDASGNLLSETNAPVPQHATCHYDLKGRLLSRTDDLGNTTRYTYDPLTSQITEVDFPPIDIEGQLTPVTTRASYDPLGRKLTEQDANGNTIAYCYNAYGSPTEIRYPDGSTELFRYTKNGALATHTRRDGLTIHSASDGLGRAVSKTYTKEGETLAQETFTYSGLQLISQTDKEGQMTRFSYDGAGRKVLEDFCGRQTHFTYDALGRLASIRTHDLITHYARDLAGRVVEEKKLGTDGTLLHSVVYSYDADGNRTAIQRTIHGRKSVQRFRFDPFGRCLEETDAEGNVTTKRYEEQTNALGQRVLRLVTTDSLQNKTVETYDALRRLVKLERCDAIQERIYDACGNLLVQRAPSEQIRYTYTPMHQVKSCNTTLYTYHAGKLAIKTLPDGTTLHYAYHPLGFLSRIDSSDGAIQYAFVYDRLGRLTAAADEKEQLRIERRLDPFGNVLFESFPSGLTVEKSYDALNRPTSLALPHAKIHYSYDPLYPRQVTRCTPSGEALYTHTFSAYDDDGHLLLELPPGNLSYISHRADMCGRKTSISSPYFSEQCQYDACGNRIESLCDGSECSYAYDAHSQLLLENSPDSTFSYAYDSFHNRIEKNGSPASATICDLNGCQTSTDTLNLSYDPLQRLVAASTPSGHVVFTYDPLGRRLSKTLYQKVGIKEEHYLYDGDQEIGCFSNALKPLAFRILAGQRTLAIELKDHTYIPIYDIQGSIRRLIDLNTRRLADAYDFSAFGEELLARPHLPNPWRFAAEHFDPDLNLIAFGTRFYNPLSGRWLTPDPYCYLSNNPFK